MNIIAEIRSIFVGWDCREVKGNKMVKNAFWGRSGRICKGCGLRKGWEEDDENVKTVGTSGLSNLQPTEPYNLTSQRFDIYIVFLSLYQNITTYIVVAYW